MAKVASPRAEWRMNLDITECSFGTIYTLFTVSGTADVNSLPAASVCVSPTEILIIHVCTIRNLSSKVGTAAQLITIRKKMDLFAMRTVPSVQAEFVALQPQCMFYLFWSLKDTFLFCPGATSSVYKACF